MTISELMQLSEDNYEYIKALNIIATELLHKGTIISDNRKEKDITEIVIKNDNILYGLRMYGADTCRSITWERIKELSPFEG